MTTRAGSLLLPRSGPCSAESIELIPLRGAETLWARFSPPSPAERAERSGCDPLSMIIGVSDGHGRRGRWDPAPWWSSAPSAVLPCAPPHTGEITRSGRPRSVMRRGMRTVRWTLVAAGARAGWTTRARAGSTTDSRLAEVRGPRCRSPGPARRSTACQPRRCIATRSRDIGGLDSGRSACDLPRASARSCACCSAAHREGVVGRLLRAASAGCCLLAGGGGVAASGRALVSR